MEQIFVGTSGWSYPTGYGKWKGVFYPPRMKGDELAYYAERFPAVEVNSSFYRIPAAKVVTRWAEITPDDFRFTMKLYRKFTHPEFYEREEEKSPEILPEDVAGMRSALDALAERGKLGALLLQYPDFFYKNDETASTLVRTMDYFREYPLAVELRNASWDNGHTRELLGFFDAAFVRIDEPFFENLDEPFAPTDTLQYWRFHGRNTTWWRKRGAGHQRYDYRYSPDEIDDLAETVRAHANPTQANFVFFNNHPGGKAAANAVELAARLKLPLPYQKFHLLGGAFPDLQPITGVAGEQLTM